MRMILFTVYDAAIEAYSPPFCHRTVADAIRVFVEECNNPQSRISKSPEHFHLFAIGTYDDGNGVVEMYVAHQSCAKAVEHVKKS